MQTKKETSKRLGCLIGMIVGDAVGATYEFHTLQHPGEIELPKETLPMLGGGGGPSKRFGLAPGNWTDDASMGLCLAEGLLQMDAHRELPSVVIMDLFWDWWNLSHNSGLQENHAVGLGGVISKSLSSWKRKRVGDPDASSSPENNALTAVIKSGVLDKCDGNGSIMRCAAAAAFARTPEEAMKFAYGQSLITTPGLQSANCSRLLAYLSYQAMVSPEKDPIKLKETLLSPESFAHFMSLANQQELPLATEDYKKTGLLDLGDVAHLCHSEWSDEKPHLNWRCSFTDYQFNFATCFDNDGTYYGAYVMDGMSLALNILYNTNSFEEAITMAALVCGDADTNAAIVAQMAGAIYGVEAIPKCWTDEVYRHPLNVGSDEKVCDFMVRCLPAMGCAEDYKADFTAERLKNIYQSTPLEPVEEIAEERVEVQEETAGPNVPPQQFSDLLLQLKTQAASLKSRKEMPAYKAAQNLYDGISEAATTYFSAKQTDATYTTFNKCCQRHIDAARPELEKQRGFKKIIGNIIIAIRSFGCEFMQNKTETGQYLFDKFPFFKTKSQDIVHHIAEEIKKKPG